MRFRDRRFGARKMQQPEIHDDRVEAGRIERQRLCVALAKRDAVVSTTRVRNHGGREVEPRHDRAASGCCGGDEPGAGRDVEQS